MIPILLRDLRWRLVALLLVAWVLYLLEPGFHTHDQTLAPNEAVSLGPVGVSATLSYFAGLSMILLLAGFISTDRTHGYTRIFFAHPTRPLAFYGLRWALALGVSLVAATLFLVIGQLVAWGEFRGGWSGLLLALLSALIYGGLMAFLSSALPRGDGWVAFLLFLPTLVPQLFGLAVARLPVGARQALQFVLPPQGALQVVWQGLLEGIVAWGAVAYAGGYGVLWLLAGILILRAREWP